VVPTGTTSTHIASAFGKVGYMLDFGGDPSGRVRHWLVTGTSFEANWRMLTANGNPDLRKRTSIDGVPVRIFWVTGYQNQNQGHVVFLWRQRGVSHLVSVHGLDNESIARGIAEGLVAAIG
jgi:hypothetical protein